MELKDYLNPAEEKMELAVDYLDETLARIRAGKANAKILEGIRVEYYGSAVPISNVANVSVPDARTIAITPWEKSMFKEIEKAIINSELGITPENNGEIIRLTIPPLTEDRRKSLVKQCKGEAENAKVSVRNARRDAIEGLKKAVKNGMPEDVQKDGEEIEVIVAKDPDVSQAVWAFQRLCMQGVEIEIRDLNGTRIPEAEDLFNYQCRFWNPLSQDGLDGIIDNLHKVGLLYNTMIVEVVVDNKSGNTFSGIYIIDPRTIEWQLEQREGKEQWIPYQDQEEIVGDNWKCIRRD